MFFIWPILCENIVNLNNYSVKSNVISFICDILWFNILNLTDFICKFMVKCFIWVGTETWFGLYITTAQVLGSESLECSQKRFEFGAEDKKNPLQLNI